MEIIDKSRFVNHFDLALDTHQRLIESNKSYQAKLLRTGNDVGIADESFLEVQGIFKKDHALLLQQDANSNGWQAVGLDGIAGKPIAKIGNYRLTNYNPALAIILWERLRTFIPTIRRMDAHTPTDHYNHALWAPVGVNPLFRYIRYVNGGQLVGHYDATYEESDTRRSLMSLVIYLTSNRGSGATRFLYDAQEGKRMDEMDFSDWSRTGYPNEVKFSIEPVIGNAIVFDHRILHDGEPLLDGSSEKLIIRSDIMFEAV